MGLGIGPCGGTICIVQVPHLINDCMLGACLQWFPARFREDGERVGGMLAGFKQQYI